MAQQEELLSPCPIPLGVQPHERIKWLKECLEDPENQRQRTNILALIRMYESGELGPLMPGHTIYVCDGKIMDKPFSSENLPPRECVIKAGSLSAKNLPPFFLLLNDRHVDSWPNDG